MSRALPLVVPRVLALALLAGLVPALAACQGGNAKGSQRTKGFPAPAKEVVYDVAMQSVRRQGFVVDLDASSPEQGHVVSRWKLDLAPFSRMGTRDKATVWIREVPDHRDYYVVETNVTREHNSDQVQPHNPIAADWGSAERVTDLENLITARIERYFLQPEVSADLRETYGLPTPKSTALENPALNEKEKRRTQR
jgi:hypothetical protein